LLEKSGVTCHLSLDVLLTANSSATSVIATLPTGYRPSGTFYVPCRVSNNVTYQSTHVQIQSGGNVIIRSGLDANSYVMFDTTYLIPSV